VYTRNDPGGAGLEGISTASVVPSLTAEEVSDLTGLDTGEETLVRQEFKEEVDINVIMRRFGAGVVNVFGSARPMYGDFTGISDYDSALEKVQAIDKRWAMMPAEFRDRFDNDPAKFLRKVDGMSVDEFDGFVASANKPPAVTELLKPVVTTPVVEP